MTEHYEDEAPQYELLAPFYAEDVLWPEGAVINFFGVPNEQMEALNEPAKARMTSYLEYLEKWRTKAGLAKGATLADVVYEAMLNRPKEDQLRLPDELVAQAEPRPIELPHAQHNVPIMPGVSAAGDVGKRGPGRPRTISAVERPQEHRQKMPKRVLGTIGKEQHGDISLGG